MLYTTTCQCPVGPMQLVASEKGLVAALWPKHHDKRLPFGPNDLEHLSAGVKHPVLEAAVVQLTEYFQGVRQSFDVPLDLRGSAFQVGCFASCEASYCIQHL